MTSKQELGNRKFYDIPEAEQIRLSHSPDPAEFRNDSVSGLDPGPSRTEGDGVKGGRTDLMSYIDNNVIGTNKVLSGPFGLRKVVYCDYTASGRSLKFIEDYIQEQVLPDYGNTHTTTSVTSLQTTLFRHEARDIVRNAVNASEHDVVIFTGSGCTAAVHTLINAMKMDVHSVIFVGPYEHHSTLLPWRELGSEIVTIRQTDHGDIDIDHLDQELKKRACKEDHLKIGCFSAASNITGHLVNVDAITECLHANGAQAFWDYATAGPYVPIDMNSISHGKDPSLACKDAIFISPHKFVGGVQTPGILIAKKKLFQNPVPRCGGGGGSVFFVRRESHRYLQEAEAREEAGTPAIVESIRAGLVFQLKSAVGPEAIMKTEHELCSQAFAAWSSVPGLILLGSPDLPRLPIFSFVVHHEPSGRFLHHNFVCAVLNDLFGIQTRGGCACAGPYAEDLLGISEELAEKYESLLMEDSRLDRTHLRRKAEYSENEILRPGFVRLNLPYFMADDAVTFVLEAAKLVAQSGWKLLPMYKFNPETGEWRHRNHQIFKDRRWLGHISYKSGYMEVRQPVFNPKGPLPQDFEACLEQARKILGDPQKGRVHLGDQTTIFSPQAEELRWFLLPSEANAFMTAPQNLSPLKTPFFPLVYRRTRVPPSCHTRGTTAKKSQSSEVNEMLSEKVKQCIEQGFTPDFEELKDSGRLSPDDACGVSQETVQYGHQEPQSVTSDDAFGQKRVLTFGLHRENHVPEPGDSIPPDPTSCTKENPNSAVNHIKSEGIAKKCDESEDADQVSHSRQYTAELGGSSFSREDLQSESGKSGSPMATEGSCQKVEAAKRNAVCPDGACFVKRQKVDESANTAAVKHKEFKWHSPPKAIFKPTMEAIQEHSMLKSGDRVLVCLSGGKDSLSLLHTLRQYQFYAKSKGLTFDLGAVTVDPQMSAYDPSPLKPYLASLGVPYFYEEQCILETAQNLPDVASICSFCSRMKRGRIYAAARREGYNVLALGQHLDDLAESFLMSVFHNGVLRTMKACYTVQEQDLRVIRPFIYVREKDLRQFAESRKLPVIAENCPACFEAPKERHRMKQLLAAQEVLHPRLFPSLQSAIHPILSISKTGVNLKQIVCNALRSMQPDTPVGQEEDEDF